MPAEVDEDDRQEEMKKKYRGTRDRDLDFLKKYAKRSNVVIKSSGLHYRVMRGGDKNAPRPGLHTPCKVHYQGMLTDGTVFDNSYEREKPVIMKPSQVVEGWQEALQLMHEGDRWEVILPSHLGYGDRGAGPIPGGAVLIFELELLEVGAKPDEVEQEAPLELPVWVTKYAKPVAIIVLTFILFWIFQSLFLGGKRKGPELLLDDAMDVERDPRIFFDLEMNGKPVGRLEFELFGKVAPKTVENFRALSTGELGVGRSGKHLHYKGSTFHRVIPGFMAQGGDFTHGNGRGGESIYGAPFEDEWEVGVVHHTEAGLLSMANRGRDTNGAQFFITFAATRWLDAKHVVFGRVVKGMEVLKLIEAVGTKSGKPLEEILVVDSGELEPPEEAVPHEDEMPEETAEAFDEEKRREEM